MDIFDPFGGCEKHGKWEIPGFALLAGLILYRNAMIIESFALVVRTHVRMSHLHPILHNKKSVASTDSHRQ